MKTNRTYSAPAHDQVASVRAMIEREFSCLHEKQPHAFQLVLNEAEALAWQTGFPQLVFPTLADEKARSLARWHKHQRAIKQSESSLAFAA